MSLFNKVKKLPISLIFIGYSIAGHAALYDRGGGMIYDSTLDITWLQDANYAKTSGYSANGEMSYAEAQTWASNLVYGGYADWRLPSTRGSGTSTYGSAYAIGTDSDTGIAITTGEMGSLYYDSLKNPVGIVYPPPNQAAVPSSFKYSGFVDPTTGQTVSFINVESSWMTGNNAPTDNGWVFNMHGGMDGGGLGAGDGTQFNTYVFSTEYCVGGVQHTCYPIVHQAWAVRDGDVASVAAVPVPSTLGLSLSALSILLGRGIRRRLS